jgi:hypothetical protein
MNQAWVTTFIAVLPKARKSIVQDSGGLERWSR